MGFKSKTKNIIEKILSGESGRRFFQVFYSIGAAIIIVGVLAKLMHWPYGLGNFLLYFGFITEALVFIISAFDRPTREYEWNRVFPVLSDEEEERPVFGGGGGGVLVGGGNVSGGGTGNGHGGGGGGGTVIIGGASFGSGGTSSGSGVHSAVEAAEAMTPGQVHRSFGIPDAVNISEEDSNALTASIKKMAAAADQLSKMAEMTDSTQQYLDQLKEISDTMNRFNDVTNNLAGVSDVLLSAYKNITDNSDNINSYSRGYVTQMESLNRNIQGLNTIYEIQLKGVSSQIDAIERINAGLMRIKDLYEGSIVDSSVFRTETEKMAQQLHALNSVYNRLLNAMTMNMYGSGNPAFQGVVNPS
ncbi:MAG: gliding motility protein GldL [Dysgonamonadaceae bacterium]|jgi:gliding motility-associated protein GldL|nr:gliding motility protein GldL [Dysgonamonadaceae bacterium]